MALHHPVQDHRPTRTGGPHPAISLILGFVVIAAGATIVHIVFNAVM